jgi:hypothetical protein
MTTILLFGRVPTAALASVTAPAVDAVVAGKVQAATKGTSISDGLIVHAKWGFGEVSFQVRTTVSPDGSFRLVSPVNRGRLEVWVETPSEHALSTTEYVALAAGKIAKVVLTLKPDENEPSRDR